MAWFGFGVSFYHCDSHGFPSWFFEKLYRPDDCGKPPLCLSLNEAFLTRKANFVNAGGILTNFL
jgi:hypothetical protein